MGVLRLLYCDSAGVRRCRAVVYHGNLPATKEGAHCNAHASAAHTLAAAAAAADSELSTTPSLLEAAAAGIISLRPSAQPNNTHSHAGHQQQQQPQQPQQQQHSLQELQELLPADFVAVAAEKAGPFASNAAALAASEDAPQLLQNGANGSTTCIASPLLTQVSTRLLQPLTSQQTAALKVAVPYATGLTKGTMGQPAIADMVLPDSGLSAVGEVLLVPDLSAVQKLPWAEGHSIAPVDMIERELSKPFVCCPRSALKHALAALQLAHNIKLMVGFELEFMLLKPAPPGLQSPLTINTANGSFVPIDDSIYCQSSAFDQAAPVLDQMVAALESMGIGVVQYHAESAPGQFEIALTHFPALQAVDKLLLAKEAISAVARQAGLEVSFLPKPLAACAGSGMHCHISLWKADNDNNSTEPVCLMTQQAADTSSATSVQGNQQPHHHATYSVPGYPTLSSTASAFLAGLLQHLPALLPFTTPSVNSYERLRPGTWSGAVACWGWDNREAPLRLCCANMSNPNCCNIEYKVFDGTANPYIGLATIVAAGMRGLQEAAVLPPPLQVEPSSVGLTTAAGGTGAPAKVQELPNSLCAALASLQEDTSLQSTLKQLLGPELLKAYLAVKSFEAAQQASVDKLLLRY